MSQDQEPINTHGAGDVLVIDDNEDLRSIIAAVVEEATGRPALTADDNVRGLEMLLRAEGPLVVLLDRLMGSLPFDVLLTILASPAPGLGERLRRHRYIVLTASPNGIGPHERDLLANGLDGAPVVGKPFDLDELERELRAAMRWLERRARLRERERTRGRELAFTGSIGSR